MRKIEMPREEIVNLYSVQRLSTLAISQIYFCDPETVRKRLRDYGVQLRRAGPQFKRSVESISEIEAAYLAGVIDSDGSIFMGNCNGAVDGKAPMITVRNTSNRLAEWLAERVGGRVNWHDGVIDSRTGNKHSRNYHWRVTRLLDVQYLLNRMLSFLVIKKSKAQQLLQICDERIRLAEGD